MKPTFLYIKQHKVTGLKYFGKTTKKDPVAYLGSGKHWKRHIKKHGEHIETLWYQLFTDEQEMVEYALRFSKDNNIVKSQEWANLKEENGLDGGMEKGWWSEEQIELNRQKAKERWANGVYNTERMRISRLNRIGFKQPESQKIAVAKALAKEYLITDPAGNQYKIKNLQRFCRENNLDQPNMTAVASGRLKHCKQWKCVKLDT